MNSRGPGPVWRAAAATLCAAGAYGALEVRVVRAQDTLMTRVTQRTEQALRGNPTYADVGVPLQLADGYEYWEFECVAAAAGQCAGERSLQLPRPGRYVVVTASDAEAAGDEITLAVYGGSSDGPALGETSFRAWVPEIVEFAVSSARARVKVTVAGDGTPQRRIGVAVIQP